MGLVGIAGRRNSGSSELWVAEIMGHFVGIMGRRNYESLELWADPLFMGDTLFMGRPPPLS